VNLPECYGFEGYAPEASMHDAPPHPLTPEPQPLEGIEGSQWANLSVLTVEEPQSYQLHQQKTFPSGRNGSIRVDALRQRRQRHPSGGLLRARHKYHASCCTSPSDRSFAVSSSNSARAFPDAPEITCSYGGAFRTLQDLTIRIVKFWSS